MCRGLCRTPGRCVHLGLPRPRPVKVDKGLRYAADTAVCLPCETNWPGWARPRCPCCNCPLRRRKNPDGTLTRRALTCQAVFGRWYARKLADRPPNTCNSCGGPVEEMNGAGRAQCCPPCRQGRALASRAASERRKYEKRRAEREAACDIHPAAWHDRGKPRGRQATLYRKMKNGPKAVGG